MPKFNLYKINRSEQNDLVDKLNSVGLAETHSVEDEGYTLSFYFSTTPDEVDIWWTNVYSEFLPSEEDKPKNKIYFGVMLISNDSICYAISLGKSHFYLRNFCDKDFGLNLAERIVDANNLKIKNSKHFKSKKSKSITSYQANSTFDYDSGESMHYIKAKTISEAEWGAVASFGTSVQLSLELSASNLVTLIKRVERKLQQNTILNLPKTDIITDESTQESLDRKLAELIQNPTDENVVTEEFSISGVDFIFLDGSTYKFYVKGDSRNKSEAVELTTQSLTTFARERGLSLAENLNNIMVSVKNEHSKAYTENIKKFLDYVDDERYCLMDGIWHRFNESYLKYINQEVDKIFWNYEPAYDLAKGQSEDYFNDNLSQNHGYINTHKNSINLINKKGGTFTVELMDLFKDNTLFFVKAGTPQKLNYVIDQSISSIKLLQNNTANVVIADIEHKVSSICLWIIIDRVTDISTLSAINSIIFLMKLADWRKQVNDAGYKPIIFVNYRRG